MKAADQRAHFERFGYLLITRCFDPGPITREVRRALRDAFSDNGRHSNSGPAGNSFQYVPMMVERTPVSLALVTGLANIAANLLDKPVLPGRAKGTRYAGSTGWHRDSESPVRSLGMLCYLDPLNEDTGALQVLPGSHRQAPDTASEDGNTPERPASALPLVTSPGDLVVIDEHLVHASDGGTERLQWRVDSFQTAVTTPI